MNAANEIIFELQDRIDKAIEYIEEHQELYNVGYCFTDGTSSTELLKILKGGE